MKTYIAYFDESGDDGVATYSCDHFVLTSVYMPTDSWQTNFDIMKNLRHELKEKYGFHTSQEMHTNQFLTDKNPYREYGWSAEQRRDILIDFTKAISKMNIKIINVIIDKTKIKEDDYPVLERALTYNIQRIENDSKGNDWNYFIITDEGRIAPMRKTARKIRSFNPVQSKYNHDFMDQPIKNLIEDIMEKKSSESYFIQVADFVSYFVHLYFDINARKRELPNRIQCVIDKSFVGSVLATLLEKEVLNVKATKKNRYGLVIYPR